MRMSGVSLLGWIHTVACVVALISGAWNVVAAKGTATHKRWGTVYAASMIIAMVSSFGVYRFDPPLVHRADSTLTGFGVFHWTSVAALTVTVIGYYGASRQQRGFWAYAHPIAMVLSYYLLIGGFINELFARVAVLRPLAFVVVKGQIRFGADHFSITGPGAALENTHHVNELATLFLVVLFSVKVWRYRRDSAPGAA